MCERCWADAYMRLMAQPMKTQAQCYEELIEERRDTPCTPQEQAGSWWCELHQMDRRSLHHSAACDELAGL